jgi:hypothetical protein
MDGIETNPAPDPVFKLLEKGLREGVEYLISLFGVEKCLDIPRRQRGEFNRLCEVGMPSNTLEEFKQLIRADAGPPEPTYEDVVDAAAALRKRIDEDAVRWVCRRLGYHKSIDFLRNHHSYSREFIRLSRLEAGTAEDFAKWSCPRLTGHRAIVIELA